MPTETALVSNQTILHLVPELILLLVATAIYVAGAFWRLGTVWNWVAAGGLIATAVALAVASPLGATGPLAADALGDYVRWLVLVVTLLFVLLSARSVETDFASEHVASILMIAVGLMLVAGARELVLLFVGLELVSIPTYLLLYLGRHDVRSQEAAAKYFFLSVLSSALMLYGFSFLYGVGGSTQLAAISQALAEAHSGQGTGLELGGVGLILVFAGLGFRITAVPFHFYAPDVYQGTTNGNAGLLAVVPKIAGFVALVRIASIAMPGLAELGWQLALVLSAITMTLGNLLALWQNNLRRLFAYSSIAHAGYMLIGVAVGFASSQADEVAGGINGLGATLLYLAVYVLAVSGTFAAFNYLGGRAQPVEEVDDLAGVGYTHPLAGVALAVFMFSLAGLPPLAGFWGKLALFSGALTINVAPGDEALRQWFVGMAVLGVLNAAVAAAYYLRIVAMLFFRQPRAVLPGTGGPGPLAAMALALLLVIGIGAYPGPLSRGAVAVGVELSGTRQEAPPTVAAEEASTARIAADAR